MPSLEQELRYALEDAVIGKPIHRRMANDLGAVARAVLLRRGLSRWGVEVRQQGTGFWVRVTPPPGRPEVEQVVVRLG